jgi:hypothetical protein
MHRRLTARGSLGLLAALVLAGSPAAQPVAGGFVHIAEGFTAAGAKEGIETAFRLWSAPDMAGLCAGAHADRVIALRTPTRVTLHTGRGFPLSDLKVVAVDASGTTLPRVPIQIEIDPSSPPIVDTRSDRVQDSVLVPSRSGRFRLRIATACGGRRADATITARVVP